jgi:hypothetical protein
MPCVAIFVNYTAGSPPIVSLLSFMSSLYQFHENNPLDFLIAGHYIFYQTLGQIVEGPAQVLPISSQKERAHASTWTDDYMGYACWPIDARSARALAPAYTGMAERLSRGHQRGTADDIIRKLG